MVFTLFCLFVSIKKSIKRKNQSSGLDQGAIGPVGDSTNVDIPCHLYVSSLSPASPPAVLDQPVIPSPHGAIANNHHNVVCIIGFVGTECFIPDSAAVKL